MNIEQKKQFVENLKDALEKAESALFVDYSGLGAAPLDDLRGKLLEEDGGFQVVKNTLLLRALGKMENDPPAGGWNIEGISLSGPTALVLSFEDALKGIKIVSNYKKDVGSLEFKGGIFEGALIDSSEAAELAEIPGREALLVEFVLLAQAPLQRMVATANAPVQRLSSGLKTLSERE